MHFTYDISAIIIISIPLCYLIIKIVRKFKKKKYIWFFGIKGIILFIVDIIILILLPIFIIIFMYAFSADVRYAVDNITDIKFVLFTFCSALFLTFIIKLVYIFIYNKYSRKFELVDEKRVEELDSGYMGIEDEK